MRQAGEGMLGSVKHKIKELEAIADGSIPGSFTDMQFLIKTCTEVMNVVTSGVELTPDGYELISVLRDLDEGVNGREPMSLLAVKEAIDAAVQFSEGKLIK